jgi:hypothetical protein
MHQFLKFILEKLMHLVGFVIRITEYFLALVQNYFIFFSDTFLK